MSRTVAAARSALRDWLAQRITAVIMAAGTLVFIAAVLGNQPMTYAAWKELFAQGWMRALALLFVASLAWHMWVGMRDILMDYVRPVGVRLALQVGVLLAITIYLAWAAEILWR